MFNKLDMNYDLLLDNSELSAIYLDKYELCMQPLFNSCDSFKDGKLSNNEWCYCFQKPDGERDKHHSAKMLGPHPQICIALKTEIHLMAVTQISVFNRDVTIRESIHGI